MKLALGRLGSAGTRTLIQRAIASLRARGSDAHLWLPGGDVKTYGAELVVNGGFDTDSVWVKGNNTTISGGTLNILGGSTATTQPYTITSGQSFSVTYTITSVTTPDSGMRVRLGSTASGTLRTTAGTYSEILTATASGSSFVVEVPSLFVGSIDNISVREITSITPTITSGLTTGNYLESTGNSVATVDNPCGLVLDALGSVGANRISDPDTGVMTPGGTTPPVFSATTYLGMACRSLAFSLSGSVAYGNANAVASETAVTSALGDTLKVEYQISLSRVLVGTEKVQIYDQTHSIYTTDVNASNSSGAIGAWLSTTYIGKVTSGGGYGSTIAVYCSGTFTAPLTVYLRAVSVREVSGIHLTQGTTANKAVLRRGLTNLLTYSSDFTNAAWVTEGTASKVGNVLNMPVSHGDDVYHATLLPAGTYTNAFVLSGSGTISLFCYNPTDHIFAVKQITLTATPTIYVNVASPTVSNNIYYFGRRTGDTATSVTFGCGGLFQGTLTASEILAAGGIPATTTAAASNPNAGKYSWAFDGSNDSLTLGSVPFQMGDDFAVVAGATSHNNSGYPTIAALAYRPGGYCAGMLWLHSNNTLYSTYKNDADTVVNVSAGVTTIGTSFVGAARKVGDSVVTRLNGVSGTAGTAPSGAATLNVSSIGAGDAFFNGTIGPVLAIKGTVTDAELLMYERLVAALTPGAPTF